MLRLVWPSSWMERAARETKRQRRHDNLYSHLWLLDPSISRCATSFLGGREISRCLQAAKYHQFCPYCFRTGLLETTYSGTTRSSKLERLFHISAFVPCFVLIVSRVIEEPSEQGADRTSNLSAIVLRARKPEKLCTQQPRICKPRFWSSRQRE